MPLNLTNLTHLQALADRTAQETAAIKASYALKTELPTKVSDLTNDANFMTSTEVHSAIADAVASYKEYKGSIAFSELTSALLVADNVGNVYNITNAFTTTADFIEGAGKKHTAGTNVAIANVGTAEEPSYKFDVLAGDLSGFQEIVEGATSGNFAKFNANGQIEDSGKNAASFVEAEAGKRLMTTDEGTKLAGIAAGATKVEASETNGNVKINGTETTVFALPDTVLHSTDIASDASVNAMIATAFGDTQGSGSE